MTAKELGSTSLRILRKVVICLRLTTQTSISVRLAGIHARSGDRSDASSQSGDNGESHFIGLIGDDAEFDGGVKAVGNGVVSFAFDVLFARGHNERKDFSDGIVGEVFIDKE